MSTHVSVQFCSPRAVQEQYKFRTSSRPVKTPEVAACTSSGHHVQVGDRTGARRDYSNAHLTALPTAVALI